MPANRGVGFSQCAAGAVPAPLATPWRGVVAMNWEISVVRFLVRERGEMTAATALMLSLVLAGCLPVASALRERLSIGYPSPWQVWSPHGAPRDGRISDGTGSIPRMGIRSASRVAAHR